jgi:hypothetical protein
VIDIRVSSPFTEFQADANLGEVNEAARGHELRRALSQLLARTLTASAPGTASLLTAGLVVAPRAPRWIASADEIATADARHIACKKPKTTSTNIVRQQECGRVGQPSL